MIAQAALTSLIASLVLLLAGYLFGARWGRLARKKLLEKIQDLSLAQFELQDRAEQLQAERARIEETVEQLLAGDAQLKAAVPESPQQLANESTGSEPQD